MAKTIDDLYELYLNIYETVLQLASNNVPVVDKVDSTANKVDALTPNTYTKTAYYGESEKTFYGVANGNITVYFDNYNGNYSVSRVSDRVTVSFDTLTDSTKITLSII